jgi:hypothetical protein
MASRALFARRCFGPSVPRASRVARPFSAAAVRSSPLSTRRFFGASPSFASSSAESVERRTSSTALTVGSASATAARYASTALR